MGERFVDVSYRGLEVGRRAKLHEVRAETGWVDVPLPMPVGTAIELATDEGLRIAARVVAVHEQVGGSEQPPGMKVQPELAGASASWWQAQVDTAPEPVAPAPVAAARAADATPPEGTRATAVMSTDAVEAALAEVEADRDRDDGLVDDGKRTTVMNAIDVSMITGVPTAEIGVTDDADAGGDDDAEIVIEASEPDDGDGTVSGEMPAATSGPTNGANGANGKRTSGSRATAGKRKRRKR